MNLIPNYCLNLTTMGDNGVNWGQIRLRFFNLHVSRELFQCDNNGLKLGANRVKIGENGEGMGRVGFQSTPLPVTFLQSVSMIAPPPQFKLVNYLYLHGQTVLSHIELMLFKHRLRFVNLS